MAATSLVDGTKKLTVVTPTYNEAPNLDQFFREVCDALEGLDYEILVVDDDSPDQTWKLAEEAGQKIPNVRVLRRTSERGLGKAVSAGFRCARGEIVACMDADLQHDPGILRDMVRELDEGAEIAVGSRYVAGGGVSTWNMPRRFFSRLATQAARFSIGVKVADPMSGYFALPRESFLRVQDQINPDGFKILLEILAKLKPQKIKEVPFTFRPRFAGQSKLSTRVVFQYFLQLWRLSRAGRSTLPGSRR